LQKIVDRVKELVPVGFNWHDEQQTGFMPTRPMTENAPIVNEQFEKGMYQLGTLGGGNHFIEIQQGSDGNIWVMIHSGSRNIGHKVATHYNNLAKDLNKKWYSSVPKEWDLAYLPIDTKEAKLYMTEMKYCVEFAFANRKLMMERVKLAFQEILPVGFFDLINIAHNYASWENHYNQNVIVHRKGATRAYLNEVGIIPGSMGTKSYIVEGLGNKESFQSCSHGAGRIMGRKQAQRELNLENERNILNSQNIIHDVNGIENLDEAPSAYKDIDKVMQNQIDLVKIKTELKPMAVIKG
jgi:tRNA-splicing ligase RtcB (3'-phosphate/5'-hydroxy nucleic acid ligase)